MLRKRTCILVSMSIPCHICKGKGVSGAGLGARVGAHTERPGPCNRLAPSSRGGDATNLEEVFEGDALVHLVRPLGAAREKTLRPLHANRAGVWGHQGCPLGPWDISHGRTALALHNVPWPAQHWFPEPPRLQGAAFFRSTQAPSTVDGALWGAVCSSPAGS